MIVLNVVYIRQLRAGYVLIPYCNYHWHIICHYHMSYTYSFNYEIVLDLGLIMVYVTVIYLSKLTTL